MTCVGHTQELWNLAPREHVLLDGARGTTLRVTRGTLWITLETTRATSCSRRGDVVHGRPPRGARSSRRRIAPPSASKFRPA